MTASKGEGREGKTKEGEGDGGKRMKGRRKGERRDMMWLYNMIEVCALK